MKTNEGMTRKQLFCVVVIAYILSAVWEFLHYPLYDCPLSQLSCALRSASIDVILIVGLYLISGFILQRKGWICASRRSHKIVIAVVAVILAYLIELNALWMQKWSYSALMPIIPLLHVGLSPLIQLPITTLLTLYLAKRIDRTLQCRYTDTIGTVVP